MLLILLGKTCSDKTTIVNELKKEDSVPLLFILLDRYVMESAKILHIISLQKKSS